MLGIDVIKAKITKMITWHRAACSFHKPTVIITFDEAPVSFNSGYVQKMVLYEGEQPVQWAPTDESKRMFTLVLVLFLKPICIFKGKNQPP